MTSSKQKESEEHSDSKFLAITQWITDCAVDGVPPLTSAENLAKEYLLDRGYVSHDHRVEALIRWETSKNFTTGFLTGLGGILTLPVSVPAALGAAWVVQARLAGAIAHIYGHDLRSDRVRTLVLLSLVGDSAKEVVKRVGIEIGKKSFHQLLMKIPGRVLIEINKKVGYRLITKAGEKGIINLTKAVPIVGGVVGGIVDATGCYAVGNIATTVFRRDDDEQSPSASS